MKRFVVLIDNNPHPVLDLQTEHGLSFYFEIDDRKCLLDVGASDKFISNAEKLGIAISEVDTLILSHSHADHTGGLEAFLKANSKAKVYLSANILGEHYFSTRRGFKKDISIDYSLFSKFQDRFIRVTENIQISPSIEIIADISTKYPRPIGNSTLMEGDKSDDFSHEIALTLKDEDARVIVVSSCSHKGVLNTLEACACSNIKSYVGGMHLLDSDEKYQYESQENLQTILHTILFKYPGIKLLTGHCTGTAAKSYFKSELESRISLFYSGFEVKS